MPVITPAEVIDELETFDLQSLADWIDYVERCILNVSVASFYKQGTLKNIRALHLNQAQAIALQKMRHLSFTEQRAVVQVAKVLCRSMKQTSQ